METGRKSLSAYDYGMGILRILACFMVVMEHTSAYGMTDFLPDTYTWKVLNIYNAFSRCCVICFFMISGSAILSQEKINIKKLWTKQIPRLIIAFISCRLFYAAADMGFKKVVADIPLLFTNAYRYSKYHLWFLPQILEIYIVIPLLHKLVRNCDKRVFRYFIIIFFIITIVLQTVKDLPFISKELKTIIESFFQIDLIRYPGYFLLGYFLSNLQFEKKFPLKKCVFGYILSSILIAGFTEIISSYYRWHSDAMYGNFSIFVFFQGISLFLAFVRRPVYLTERRKKLVKTLAQTTFFIYLAHPFFLDRIRINLHFYTESGNVLFTVPFVALIVFISSAMISCGLHLLSSALFKR